LLALSLSSGFLAGESKPAVRSVEGTVQDPDGAAVAGAQIVLQRADGSEAGHVLSDGAGGFQFRNVPPGLYVIDVQQTGFQERKVTAVADSSSRAPLRIVLSVDRSI
jgi:hypothetical protein